ncbi:hypothetical protein [Rickettsiales endosymbiont of Trichoplax sp. H2]|uniref:hypothetical protein n=1 Tax=Rickettsiales endosymbiont of Trichoplax sp. H2 TaxID=2021221 RepID=UPI0012B41BC6|nr:hypothetical protein [Rickettsiales endosymbiont of Trichoplax sp. H2]MSO14169.1 hypothetical protein [Rickettsiales endosymbiont of Trichoplax sp. H2]
MVCPHCVYTAAAVTSSFFGAGAVANIKGIVTVSTIGVGFYLYGGAQLLSSVANIFNLFASTKIAYNFFDDSYMKGSVSVCAVSSIAYYIGGLPYVNYGLLSINILGAGSSLYNYFTHTSHDDDHNNHHHHHMEALTKDFSQLTVMASHLLTEGTSKNEKFIVPENTKSKIFGKGGLDSFILSSGKDHLYFSMCSTKITDGKVSTIWNFNPSEDKVYLFCTKKELAPEDVHLHKVHGVTYIIIAGKFEETGIAVYMENDSDELTLVDNIVLNERFSDLTE